MFMFVLYEKCNINPDDWYDLVDQYLLVDDTQVPVLPQRVQHLCRCFYHLY